MRDFIADKELSDHQPLQESDALSGSIDAANDDEHEENKKKRSYKKGATLRLDGPIAGLCSSRIISKNRQTECRGLTKNNSRTFRISW